MRDTVPSILVNMMKTKEKELAWSTQEMESSMLRAQFVAGLVSASRTLRRRSELVARLHGFTAASVGPLIQLGRIDGGMRLTRLAELMDSDSVSVSRIVRNLESDGYLVRGPDPDDGRAQLLNLTRKGQDVADAAEISLIEFRRQLLSGITDEEMESAMRVFDAIAKNAEGVDMTRK